MYRKCDNSRNRAIELAKQRRKREKSQKVDAQAYLYWPRMTSQEQVEYLYRKLKGELNSSYTASWYVKNGTYWQAVDIVIDRFRKEGYRAHCSHHETDYGSQHWAYINVSRRNLEGGFWNKVKAWIDVH